MTSSNKNTNDEKLSIVGVNHKKLARLMDKFAKERYENELAQLGAYDRKNPTWWRRVMSLLQFSGHPGRVFLCLLGQLSDVDVYDGYQFRGLGKKRKINFDQRYASVGKLKQLRRIIHLLYYISVASLTINTLFQYPYDYHFIRLQTFKAIVAPGTNTIDLSFHVQAYSFTPFIRKIRTLQYQAQQQQQQQSTQNSAQGNQSLALQKFETDLENLVQKWRSYLRIIGSPYISLHFVIQLIYWSLAVIAVYLLDFLYYYQKAFEPFDFSLLRAFLDWKHEQYLVIDSIRAEIDRFLISSKNYVHNQLELTRKIVEETQTSVINELDEKDISDDQKQILASRYELIHLLRSKFKKESLNSMISCKMIKRMAISGQLLPCNREMKWIRNLNEFVIIFILVFMGYAYLIALILAFGFFLVTDYEILLSFRDILVICEAGVLAIIIPAVGAFYICFMGANCIDQLRYVKQTKKLISECIIKNEQCFKTHQRYKKAFCNLEDETVEEKNSTIGLKSSGSFCIGWIPMHVPKIGLGRLSDPTQRIYSNWSIRKQSMAVMAESNIMQMNENLLEVYMHYRIFMAQIKPITRSFGPFTFGCILLMINMPLSLRVHVTYLDDTIKLYTTIFCLILIGIADGALLPLCYMYCRCCELRKSLTNLLAHIVTLTHQVSHKYQPPGYDRNQVAKDLRLLSMDKQIYDSHLVWLLRKELNYPEAMVDKFAIHAFGIRLTYANLLRVHFWVGFLSLSIVIQTSIMIRASSGTTTTTTTSTSTSTATTTATNKGPSSSKQSPLFYQQEFLSSLLSDPFGVFQLGWGS